MGRPLHSQACRECRFRMYYLPFGELPRMLSGRVCVVGTDMPRDAEVVNVHPDFLRNSLGVMMASMSFDSVAANQEMPSVDADLRLREFAKEECAGIHHRLMSSDLGPQHNSFEDRELRLPPELLSDFAKETPTGSWRDRPAML